MRYGMFMLAMVVAVAGCTPCRHNLPPAQRLLEPGPGVGGPGPGVMMHQPGVPTPAQASQVSFVGPEGMVVSWDISMPGQFDSQPLVCPGRHNFPQAAIYRLKLVNIPGRPGAELYPTLELGPSMPRTQAFLAHNSVPVQFTEEDFDQVLSGNFVTKVIYLPDPEYQELALAGVETLVSTRLDPGVDPIVEADRRGAILGVIRLGNKDLEIPGAMGQPSGVVPAAYMPGPNGQMIPVGMSAGMPMGNGGAMPTNYISGVTGPQYGMPIVGTPIGLPGPPHIPMGSPAGLQKHTMRNYTRHHLPGPTEKVKIHVRQEPGFSYPKPASRAWIVEQAVPDPARTRRPLGDLHHASQGTAACESGCAGGACQ